jgi:hypothetical protein
MVPSNARGAHYQRTSPLPATGSQSEHNIVVAWFLWNWAGDAFLRLMAELGIALK